MSRLVNWEWDSEQNKTKDIEDLFLPSKKKKEDPPINHTEILTRDDMLRLSIKSDLEASKDAFDFHNDN